jgi:formylmethanofuran dehydrogenase subunit E
MIDLNGNYSFTTKKYKLKEWAYAKWKASAKCQECGDILGESRFRSRFSNDAIFCRKDCASKNEIKVKNNMVDNDESEFYI